MTGNRALYRSIHEERGRGSGRQLSSSEKKKDFLTAKILERERERER